MIKKQTVFLLKCDKCKTVIGDYWTEAGAEQSEGMLKATRKGKCLCEDCYFSDQRAKSKEQKHD